MTKTVLKKNKVEVFCFLYYTSVVIKAVCYWHKNRHIDQWNRIRALKSTQASIYDREPRIYNGKKTVCSVNGFGRPIQPHVE